MSAALRLSATVSNATIVCIICDRGDRYLSTGVFYSLPCLPASLGQQEYLSILRGPGVA